MEWPRWTAPKATSPCASGDGCNAACWDCEGAAGFSGAANGTAGVVSRANALGTDGAGVGGAAGAGFAGAGFAIFGSMDFFSAGFGATGFATTGFAGTGFGTCFGAATFFAGRSGMLAG